MHPSTAYAHHVSQTLTFAQVVRPLTAKMTLGSLLSQMGLETKQLTERFSPADYGGAGGHDSHAIYAYEPPTPHVHVASSKHHHHHHHGGGGGGHKSNSAMSALTLLAFLFFLHILQQCLRDHMMSMTTSTPIMIMTAGREGEEAIAKVNNKLDKSGVTDKAKQITEINNENHKLHDNSNVKKKPNGIDDRKDMTKINAAQHKPKIDAERYRNVIKNYGNQSFALSGYVSAMDVK